MASSKGVSISVDEIHYCIYLISSFFVLNVINPIETISYNMIAKMTKGIIVVIIKYKYIST